MIQPSSWLPCPPKRSRCCVSPATADPEAVASHTADLLHALQDTTLEPDGPPVAWFYDPPWTIPMLRRNEIAVPVMQR